MRQKLATQQSKRLLNINQASEYVAICPDTIRELIAKRKFPFKNISQGQKAIFRFDVKELDRWIDYLPGLSVDDLLS